MKKLASSLLTILVLFGPTAPAFAWGDVGHKTVGQVAELRLSPGTLNRIRAILKDDESLASIATWADSVKRMQFGPTVRNSDPDTQAFLRDVRNKGNGGWHFVNLALGCPGYDECNVAPIKFTKPDDIVQMINVCIRTLKGPGGPNARFSKRNALRLLVHLVGDLHQPLHVGTGFIDSSGATIKIERDPALIKQKGLESDIGANKLLIVKADSSNMHSHWDSDFVGDLMDANDTFAELAKRLKNDVSVKPEWSPQGAVETWATQWATDSVKASDAKAYPGLKIRGQRFEQKEEKGEMVEQFIGFETSRPPKYDELNREVVREQLAKGGFRLAKLLEAIFQ